MKKSPVGSWRSFFNLGKSSSVSKRKLQRNPSEPSEMKVIALAGKAAKPACKRQQCVGFMLSVCLDLLLAFKSMHNIFSYDIFSKWVLC